jgi:hypothetical protein
MKSQTPQKALKFNFIKLSKAFFLTPKVKLGKETACPPERFPDRDSALDDGGWQRRVKFLAIFDHVP